MLRLSYGILLKSKRMLVEGLGGAFYMISGRAFHKYELGSENCYVNMSNLFKWDGTMVLMRIPTEAPTRFNYIDYLE